MGLRVITTFGWKCFSLNINIQSTLSAISYYTLIKKQFSFQGITLVANKSGTSFVQFCVGTYKVCEPSSFCLLDVSTIL